MLNINHEIRVDKFRRNILFSNLILFKAFQTKTWALAAGIDQDQTAQNVQSDLRSTPSA